jgi:hypothetical protein
MDNTNLQTNNKSVISSLNISFWILCIFFILQLIIIIYQRIDISSQISNEKNAVLKATYKNIKQQYIYYIILMILIYAGLLYWSYYLSMRNKNSWYLIILLFVIYIIIGIIYFFDIFLTVGSQLEQNGSQINTASQKS